MLLTYWHLFIYFSEGKDLAVFIAVMFDIEVFVVTIVLKSRPHEGKHMDSMSNSCANASDK